MHTRTPYCRALLLCFLLLATSFGDSGAADPLRIHVTPTHSYEPAVVRIRVDIEPFEDNRRLVIAADSGSFFRSSDIRLEGANAPRIHEMAYDGLPSGEYVLAVELHGVDGARATRARSFFVIGTPGR